jgi:hypothetical protein
VADPDVPSHDIATAACTFLVGMHLCEMIPVDSLLDFFDRGGSASRLLLELVAHFWQAFNLLLVVEKTYSRVKPAVEVRNVPSQELGIFLVPFLFLAEDAASVARGHGCFGILVNRWDQSEDCEKEMAALIF